MKKYLKYLALYICFNHFSCASESEEISILSYYFLSDSLASEAVIEIDNIKKNDITTPHGVEASYYIATKDSSLYFYIDAGKVYMKTLILNRKIDLKKAFEDSLFKKLNPPDRLIIRDSIIITESRMIQRFLTKAYDIEIYYEDSLTAINKIQHAHTPPTRSTR